MSLATPRPRPRLTLVWVMVGSAVASLGLGWAMAWHFTGAVATGRVDEGLELTEQLIRSSLDHELSQRGSVLEAARAVVGAYRPRNTNVVIRHHASGALLNARDAMSADDPAAVLLTVPRIDSIAPLVGQPLARASVMSLNAPGGRMRLRRRSIELGGELLTLAVFRPELERERNLADLRRQWPWMLLLLVIAVSLPVFITLRAMNVVVLLQADIDRAANGDLRHTISAGHAASAVWHHLVETLNRLLARVAERDDEQRAFMAAAAHELRTPVAVISGEAQVALDREESDPRLLRTSLRLVRQESQSLARQVEDLFLLARLRAGETVVQATPVYLDDLVHECALALNALPLAQGRVRAQPGEGPFGYRADEGLLRRALMNLGTNALKHSAAGAPVVLAIDRATAAFVIEVRDAGEGIAVADQSLVFDRFYRGESSRGKLDGAGLGLTIAHGVVRLHGGTLELASSGPGGTTFRMTLPLVPS